MDFESNGNIGTVATWLAWLDIMYACTRANY